LEASSKGYRNKVLQTYSTQINKYKHKHLKHNSKQNNENIKVQTFNNYADRALENERK